MLPVMSPNSAHLRLAAAPNVEMVHVVTNRIFPCTCLELVTGPCVREAKVNSLGIRPGGSFPDRLIFRIGCSASVTGRLSSPACVLSTLALRFL